MAPQVSWVVAVETAGTEVQGPNTGLGEFVIKADPENTGYMYVGNDGEDAVASTSGFKLAKGETIFYVGNCSSLYIDSSVNGEKVSIFKIEAMASY